MHGIPGPRRLREGDLVKLDAGLRAARAGAPLNAIGAAAPSAHAEHTVVITRGRPLILTA